MLSADAGWKSCVVLLADAMGRTLVGNGGFAINIIWDVIKIIKKSCPAAESYRGPVRRELQNINIVESHSLSGLDWRVDLAMFLPWALHTVSWQGSSQQRKALQTMW